MASNFLIASLVVLLISSLQGYEIDISNDNRNILSCTPPQSPSPSPSPSLCRSGSTISFTTPGDFAIPNPTACRRINVTMCGGGGAGDMKCSERDGILTNGGGGAACVFNFTFQTSSLPSMLQFLVGGGAIVGDLKGGESVMFYGTPPVIVARGGWSAVPQLRGGDGGGFLGLRGGRGGSSFNRPQPSQSGGDGIVSGFRASGGGGGGGNTIGPAGDGGSVGGTTGGPASIAECCSTTRTNRCVAGGGASLLGRGGQLGRPPGIGGGGAFFQSGGDGAVFITLLD